MASLHPHDHFYSGRTSGYSSHSVSPEAEKMLKNPHGSPGPESGAIPDGLEVNQGMDFNNAPQPYYPQSQHQPAPYYDHHATSPQTQYTQTTYTNNHTPVGVPPAGEKGDPRDGRICGLRKPTFFLMLVSLFLLCALIAVAGALGAVVAQKNSELAKATASAAAGSSSTSTPSGTANAVLDLSKPAPTDTAVRKGECGTSSSKPTWEVPGTNLTFEKDCGSDYIYNDIGKVPTTNIEECIRLCAVFNVNKQTELGRCAGIVYLYKDDQGNDDPYCWLKYTKNTNQILSKDYTESAWIV
ncbi:hypothetical protein CGCS363_v004112 [Colletotrichum siamense]|uniref:uncharacterized protein n=1 Tax=Colletotrichum siamense TaxID=690259 RepID=UPI0018721AE6|nr:uncharacterized protein CGCS363_v004112 [Colletotrichum siamense]KAF5505051.1 hypothetical protein CGCS363_v004112 [Colletotrichum siamense]